MKHEMPFERIRSAREAATTNQERAYLFVEAVVEHVAGSHRQRRHNQSLQLDYSRSNITYDTPTLVQWPYPMVRLACNRCPRRG